MEIPGALRLNVARTVDGAAWLAGLPAIRARIAREWELTIGPPFTTGVAAWTAPARTSAGAEVVLKISLPHREARDEAVALHHWDGRGAVRLLAHAPDDWGLLLERCRPGTALADDDAPSAARLAAGARVLTTLAAHDLPTGPAPARGPVSGPALESGPARGARGVSDEFDGRMTPLDGRVAEMTVVCERGADALEQTAARCASSAAPLSLDRRLVPRAAALLRELPRSAERVAVVHGDLNPGNVLRCPQGPAGWVAIDPKPLIGDPAYDPWPLLAQVDDPWRRADPAAVLRERLAIVAAETGLDGHRIAAWGLARGVQSAFWFAGEERWVPAQAELDRARTWAGLIG